MRWRSAASVPEVAKEIGNPGSGKYQDDKAHDKRPFN
jgi:hypothetical protein